MTGNLGKPQPIPYVDEEDLVDLAADLGSGVFPASDIYKWHVSMIKDEGREPVGKTKFGKALKEANWHSSMEYRDGRMTRCWMISKPWARRGAEKLARLKAESEAENTSGRS